MTEINSLLTDYYKKRNQYGCLQSFNLYRDLSGLGDSEYTLEVILCDYPCYEGDQRLRLSFVGVRNIKLGYIELLNKLELNIHDIRNDQMEGINYRVIEDEHGFFSFYCEKFGFEIV